MSQSCPALMPSFRETVKQKGYPEPTPDTHLILVNIIYDVPTIALKLPKSEIKFVMDKIGSDTPKKDVPNEKELSWLLSINRLTNPICNLKKCGNKQDVFALRLCSACSLTWYCSEACQKIDWKNHKQWCCQPNAERDTGYLATRTFKRKDVVAPQPKKTQFCDQPIRIFGNHYEKKV